MSRQEANEQYAKALKAGQKHYRECVLRGRYPYPQVLDEILDDSMAAGRVDMGLLSIPTEGIVGAKAAGRGLCVCRQFHAPFGCQHRICHQVGGAVYGPSGRGHPGSHPLL